MGSFRPFSSIIVAVVVAVFVEGDARAQQCSSLGDFSVAPMPCGSDCASYCYRISASSGACGICGGGGSCTVSEFRQFTATCGEPPCDGENSCTPDACSVFGCLIGDPCTALGACGGVGCEDCLGEDTCDDGIDADGDGYADDPCDPCEEARQVAEDVGGEIHGPCDECSDNEDNVDLRFGRYLADALDVRLSSPGRVALEVVRFHRSPVRTIRNENTFGLGWVSNFAERLSGSLSGSPPSNVYWYVPGSRGAMHETCSAAGGGTYACAPMVGAHHTLKRLADNTWELVDLDGILTRFDSVGRLIGKYDRNASGFGYSVSWNGQGHLVSATDSTGRTILFVLDPENLGPGRLQVVDRVELQRSPSNIVLASYTYDRGLLVGVSAGGRGRTYEYDEGANGTHAHIARIAEESGNVTLAENTYDSESRVVETHSTFGSHAFRYDVTCWAGGPPGTLVMDLTAPELDGTGQPETCATDAQCSSGAACNSGTCYWTSCVDRDESHADKLKSITGNCGCGTSEFNWSSDLRATWVTDRNGVRTTYEYDSNGLVIAKCENDSDATVTRATPSTCPSTGRWTGIWYSSTFPGNPVEVRRKSVLSASNNSQTLLTYDANGRLDTVTEAGYTRGGSDTVVTYSYVTNHDYDTLGRLTKVDGPLSGTSDRVEYTYYPSGNGDNSYQLQRVRQYTSATAYLDTTYAAYDPYGRATQVTAANGTTTTYTFAADGRVLTTAVGGLTTSYAFDEGGRLEKATLPRGNVLLYRYDGQGRLQQLARRDVATNTDEDRLEITYDAAGRPLTRQALRQGESAWMMVKQAYDINGRLWRVYDPTDPTSQTYSEIGYDSVGRPTTDRDELGHLVESFFDSFGRLTQVRRHLDGTGSNYLSTGYAYSATFSPAPTTVTDGEGHATTYERDDLGRLTKVISPDAGTIRYVYDAAGQVVDRYAADGLRSHYVYDSAGRLTWADHDYGSASAFTSDVKYTYDTSTGCPTDISQGAAGRVARIDEQLFADTSLGDGVYDRVVCRYYDGLGRLVRETTLGDEGVTRHTEYEYDGNSNLVRLRYPMLTNAWARWDYDAAPSDNTDADDAYRVAAETTKGVTYIWAAKASERYAFGPLRRIWYGNSTATPPANPSREVLRRVDGSVSTLRDRLGGSGSWDILDRTYTYGPTADLELPGQPRRQPRPLLRLRLGAPLDVRDEGLGGELPEPDGPGPARERGVRRRGQPGDIQGVQRPE